MDVPLKMRGGMAGQTQDGGRTVDRTPRVTSDPQKLIKTQENKIQYLQL